MNYEVLAVMAFGVLAITLILLIMYAEGLFLNETAKRVKESKVNLAHEALKRYDAPKGVWVAGTPMPHINYNASNSVWRQTVRHEGSQQYRAGKFDTNLPTEYEKELMAQYEAMTTKEREDFLLGRWNVTN